jgi:hypothetical protein
MFLKGNIQSSPSNGYQAQTQKNLKTGSVRFWQPRPAEIDPQRPVTVRWSNVCNAAFPIIGSVWTRFRTRHKAVVVAAAAEIK